MAQYRPWKFACAGLGLALAAWSTPGQAVTILAGPTLSTYQFNSPAPARGAVAELVLKDYTPGIAITSANLQSFVFFGSPLLRSFSLTIGGNDGNPQSQDFSFGSAQQDQFSGVLSANLQGSNRVSLQFGNGGWFDIQGDGRWYACLPVGTAYFRGSCSMGNAPLGTGVWTMTTSVPELGTWALFGAGLTGLLALARRRRLAN